MSQYKKYPLILLSSIILIVMIGVSIKFVSNQKMFKTKDSKIMEKENENYGVIEPKSQVEGAFKPVKEIEIGETYILVADSGGGTVLRFCKLIDEKRFIYVYDSAHKPMESYGEREEEGDTPIEYINKSVCVATGTYEKNGNIYSFKTELVSGASFNYKEDVKKDSKGVRGTTRNTTSHYSVDTPVNLGLKKGEYGSITSDIYTPLNSMLYHSKIKLPNTIDEYFSQYDLTERVSQSSSSSDVKSQSHWRSDEGQAEMARAFGFDIPVSEDDDGFKIFGF
ncbi:hypothetical protein FACS1894192_12040 [Bacilli bacterium]|nr:hypothetical protein FACS1894192_12040 [Bacilli bacterium]